MFREFVAAPRLESTVVRDYFALLKPRVVILVVFTAIAGIVLAYCSGYYAPLSEAMIAILCIATGSGSASVFNMFYDRDIDAIMTRTMNRPLPKGRVSAFACLLFGALLCIISVTTMSLFVNLLSGIILAIAIFYYAVIYTILLKRKTPQNIVVGGAAGAFPPIIGWAAIANNISIQSILMFCIIFLWTPPHFWALALKSCNDYKNAKIPMLPVTSGVYTTKVQIVLYSFALVLSSLVPFFIGSSGLLYAVTAAILGGLFLYHALRVFNDRANCMHLFYFSVLYLFALFACLMVDAILTAFLA